PCDLALSDEEREGSDDHARCRIDIPCPVDCVAGSAIRRPARQPFCRAGSQLGRIIGRSPDQSTPMPHGGFLEIALLFLLAAVIAVPLFRYLGLGAVLGYLAAGVAIGPHLLGLVPDPDAILAA